MIISKRIKIGSSIASEADKILRNLEEGTIPRKIMWYAVTTTATTDGLAYIISSFEAWKKYYRTEPLRLLGLAGSWKDACEIVKDLFQEGYDQGQIFSMKSFLGDY